MSKPIIVPLLDLKAQYAALRDEIRPAVDRVLESQQCINGPEVAQMEREIAKYCGAKHCIGVSSGTDALLLSLMALDVGFGEIVVMEVRVVGGGGARAEGAEEEDKRIAHRPAL